MDELEALLGTLGKDTTADRDSRIKERRALATNSGSRATTGLDELDSLMAELSSGPNPGQQHHQQQTHNNNNAQQQQRTSFHSRPGTANANVVASSPSSSTAASVSGSRATSTRPASDELNDLIASLGGAPVSVSNVPSSRPSPQQYQAYSAPTPVVSSTLDDIDSLMASLGDTGAPSAPAPAPSRPVTSSPSQPISYPPPRPVTTTPDLDLESMIASLDSTPAPVVQTQRPSTLPPVAVAPSIGGGVSAAPHGSCGRCSRGISGQSINALGKVFHLECFVCGSCGSALGTQSFFQASDGSPTCANCHNSLFCARCAHCDQSISGSCISAIGKRYHVNCFICVQCLRPFGTSMYFERDANPFCQSCFYGIFSSRCAGCEQPIKADCINACGKQWHPEHFVCTHCKRAFGSEPYFENAGLPYCKLHFHQQQGSLCGCGCGRPVMGRVVNSLGKQWLPEHFVCGFCMNPLAGQTFTERDAKAYCNACYAKLY